MAFSLFGYEFKKTKKEITRDKIESPAPAQNKDGAISVQGSGAYSYLHSFEFNSSNKTEFELINRYRDLSLIAEVDSCIDDIVNDAIVQEDAKEVVSINLTKCEIDAKLKKLITEEFENILLLLNWKSDCYDIFKRWYIDGRLYYHAIVNESNKKDGILELRYIDPRCIKKVRELDVRMEGSTEIINVKDEYFVYNRRGITTNQDATNNIAGAKMTKDSVVYVHSGITDPQGQNILSHLHKAIRPVNQLKMMEDASVIYRISRAPERRIFGIDVGGLPDTRADQYMKDVINRFKSRTTYDSQTGEISSETNVLSVLEDYFIPKKDGNSNIDIDTLPGGENLGEIRDIEFFDKKLYKSLNIPASRMNSDAGFEIGRSSEITRDELKFMRFIYRLRLRFSQLFNELLERQIILKGILDADSYDLLRENISYDFSTDNYFAELKDSEILNKRLETLDKIVPHIGTFYSQSWVRENVLKLNEKEQKTIQKDISKETPLITDEDINTNNDDNVESVSTDKPVNKEVVKDEKETSEKD